MWLTDDQVRSIGFAACGSHVLIEESAKIFGAPSIRLGSHVRIDAFAMLSAGPGELVIGDHVHVAAGVCLYATAGITVETFASLSARVCVYSVTDDFTGGAMTNPTVPIGFRDVTAKPVSIGRHVLVGAGSVVLPGVTLARGAAVGALSLVRGDVEENEIVAGNPLRHLGSRDGERLASLEAQLLREEQG